jgi:putative transposase
MARPLRFQYPGAVYHVMARGDGGKRIFESDEDHAVFIARLGEACTSHGWRVHAWVLMGNHFHLLLETPQPNLVAGMKAPSVRGGTARGAGAVMSSKAATSRCR